MNTPPGTYSVNRLIEWMFAMVMIATAIVTALTYGDPPIGAFGEFAKVGMTDAWVIFIFVSTGCIRVFALYANGRIRPLGPWLRAGGSIIGAMMWGNLAVALLWAYFAHGMLYRGAFVSYLCFTVFELVSCHRAANDSRIGRL